MPRLVAAVLGILAIAPAPARAPLEGDPPVARHTPDVDAYPQNFTVAQDAQSVVYVGNYDGVLIYDGERWELLRLPNRDLARSLAWDGAERIYVGSHDLFGYLSRETDGRVRFHDLTALFKPLLNEGESFEDVWDIMVTRQGVFFRALRHVFLYDPSSGGTRVWRHAGRFGGMTEFGGKVVLQFRGEGLRQLVGDEWRLLPGSEPLSELAWKFLHLPDGGLLALAADGRWRSWREGRVTNYPVPKAFPPSSSMSSGIVLADGMLVMVGSDGLVYTLDPRSGAHRELRVDGGFLSDVIPARGGGLLIAGEERLLHLEWPSPWTALGEPHGLSASLSKAVRWGDRWYILTSSGVFAMDAAADGSRRFRQTGWTGSESWDLLPLDAANALLAETYDLVLVTNGKARPLSQGAFYPQKLARALADPNVVLVGLQPGIGVARRVGGAWKITLEDHSAAELETTTMVESAPHEVWLGTGRGGIWRLRFAEGYGSIVETRRFTRDDGIIYGEPAGGSIRRLADGTLVATTSAGAFRWDGTGFVADDFGGLDAVRERDEWVDVVGAPDGSLWGYSHKNVYHQSGDGWRREEIVGVRRGAIESLAFDETDAPVFITTRAMLRYEATAPAPPADTAPAVLLRALERHDAGGEVHGLPVTGPLSLPYGDFGLRLRFALPDYRLPGATRYATRLVGVDPQLSAWSDADTLQYPRLPPGTYRFEIRARDSLGRESELAPLKLRITPAWYATTMARGLWVVMLLVGLGAMTLVAVRWRTARLEGLVAARTSELRAANQRLDAMAHLDGLTGVSNRRELDRYLEKAWAQCTRDGRELAVLAIDVDGFKRFNDQHGHQAGDEMLVKLVREAAACLDGQSDLLARYGGDEFFVVRAGANLANARELAERLRKRVETAALGATVSVGVATRIPRLGGTVRELVRAADAALYAAKTAGRNRVAA